ncbi:MAG TPA: DUF2442 domain-containing protein [Pirellulales bacterium]|nr:DUF2442 domain-containing protein [Pirellulales bacterium]
MYRPIEVRPLSGYRLYLRYDNGVEGEVDLSDFAGRGVFAVWNDRAAFEKVSIGPGGEIRWSDKVDLCPDALYMRVTGASPEDLFPQLVQERRESELNA